MKQINYSQKNPQYGQINGILRIGGKFLYFKSNSNQYEQQIMDQMKQKGAQIEKSDKNWVRVDMFGDRTLVKLGDKEFDVNETPDEEIEIILYNFYLNHFTKAGFACTGKDIN